MASTTKSSVEIFLGERYPRLLLATIKKFRMDSYESVLYLDNNNFLFFDAFRDYPIQMDEFQVPPKYWALAFLQKDTEKCADILCRCIFSADDLAKRNKKGVNEGLPDVGKVAIYRAAKWMENKFQDPYSYTPGPWPTLDEQNAIKRAFERFDAVYPKKVERKTEASTQLEEPLDYSIGNVETRENYIANKMQEIHKISYSPQVYKKAYEFCFELSHIEHFPIGNTAHVARDFTKLTNPQNSDVFVDAVQFSKARWAKAYSKNNPVEIADVLFRKYLKVDFVDFDIGFNSILDWCPIKRLSLIRAVAWILMSKEKNLYIFGFNSAIKEHNVFLCSTQIQMIEDAINKKYGTISSSNNDNNHPEEISQVYTTLAPLNPVSVTETPTIIPMETKSNEQIPPTTCIVNPHATKTPQNNGTEIPIEVSPNEHTLSHVNPAKVSQDDVILLHGVEIKASTWKEACRKFRLDGGAVPAGKYLFEEIFNNHEIRHGCISGRESKFKFSSDKVDAILDGLLIIRDMQTSLESGKKVNSGFSSLERKELIRKIFVEHRSYLVHKISPDCSPNCEQCLQGQ